eukprot:365312-Chlamydomonas_euryale.AAC.10
MDAASLIARMAVVEEECAQLRLKLEKLDWMERPADATTSRPGGRTAAAAGGGVNGAYPSAPGTPLTGNTEVDLDRLRRRSKIFEAQLSALQAHVAELKAGRDAAHVAAAHVLSHHHLLSPLGSPARGGDGSGTGGPASFASSGADVSGGGSGAVPPALRALIGYDEYAGSGGTGQRTGGSQASRNERGGGDRSDARICSRPDAVAIPGRGTGGASWRGGEPGACMDVCCLLCAPRRAFCQAWHSDTQPTTSQSCKLINMQTSKPTNIQKKVNQ